jgi:hypothetical protein
MRADTSVQSISRLQEGNRRHPATTYKYAIGALQRLHRQRLTSTLCQRTALHINNSQYIAFDHS